MAVQPACALVDGNYPFALPCSVKTVVGGDGLSRSIAAASILAKTARDRVMIALDAEYPGYGFAAHKGYRAPVHAEALLRMGVTPLHRRSWGPVKLAMMGIDPMLAYAEVVQPSCRWKRPNSSAPLPSGGDLRLAQAPQRGHLAGAHLAPRVGGDEQLQVLVVANKAGACPRAEADAKRAADIGAGPEQLGAVGVVGAHVQIDRAVVHHAEAGDVRGVETLPLSRGSGLSCVHGTRHGGGRRLGRAGGRRQDDQEGGDGGAHAGGLLLLG
jgi:hypothetical protein